MTQDNHADIVLITALALEEAALLKYIGPTRESKASGRTYHRGKVGPYDVVVWCALGMGNVRAARAATEAIGIWNPAHIILVGYAGGVKKKNERMLGDVLVADQVVDYELGKETPEGTQRRYQAYRPARPLLDGAKRLPPNTWALSIETTRPDGKTGRVVPQAHFGTIASGQKVIINLEMVEELQDDWAELIGVEMEGVGVALAAYESETSPGFLLVKGISDWADPKKHDGWQQYAAEAAASFTIALLKTTPFPVVPRAQVVPSETRMTYSGEAKVAICRRLVQDWQELADVCDIPPYDRAKFERGREPAGVWEWLDARGKLPFLPTFLSAINRPDLVEELKRHP
jgi:nucleoside phosphorylase